MRRSVAIAVAAVAAVGIATGRDDAEREPVSARAAAPPVAAPAPSFVRRLAPVRERLDEPSVRTRSDEASEKGYEASLFVTTRDSGGLPVAHCRIEVLPVVHGDVNTAMHDPAHPSIRRRETDGFGAARFEDLEAREYDIRLNDPTWTAPWKRVDLAGGAGAIELEVVRAARVEGTCVDAAGFPLVGAVPSVLLKGDDLDIVLNWGRPQTISDENGRFSVAGLLPMSGRDGESLVLQLAHERYVDEPEAPIALAEGGTTDTGTIRFEIPGGRAFGRILDETGTARSGLEIFILSPRDETKPPWWFDMNTRRETGADGTFSFGPLRVGHHRVFCPPLGFRPTHPVEFEVTEPGEEIDLGDIVAAEGGYLVSGLIVGADGEPIEGAVVSIWGASLPDVTTLADGSFEFRTVDDSPRGISVVLAREPGDELWESVRGVTSDHELMIRLVPRGVRLRLLDAATGERAVTAQVTVVAKSGKGGASRTVESPCAVVRLRDGLFPGTWTLSIRARGFAPTEVEADLPPDFDEREIEVDVHLVRQGE